MAAFVGIMGVVIIAFLVNVLIAVFVWNPLSVGCIKYFIDCRYGNAEWKDILFVFRNNYVNVCVNIFLKQLFTFLWCLLLIVPGIVKALRIYEVPYILAENPDMSREEVFALSKQMMKGNKWMHLCLICLYWLDDSGALTLNIVNVLSYESVSLSDICGIISYIKIRRA